MMWLDTNSSIYPHLQTLRLLVLSHRLKNILEIGVGTGNSTKTFLQALEKTKGHLTSIDIAPLDEALAKIKNPHWRFIQEDSKTVDTLQFSLMDLVFIDSDHTYEQLKQELFLYAFLIKRKGFLVLHDINDESNAEMFPAYKEFVKENDNFIEIAYYENSNGLMVLQRV